MAKSGWIERRREMEESEAADVWDQVKREQAAAKLLGRKGGRSKSAAKLQAARENGKLGGRPTKPK